MYESKRVESNQAGVHENLEKVVRRHLDSTYKKPYQTHNLAAFEVLLTKLESFGKTPLILDSCCGTGMSTRQLAKQNPNAFVVGIDQSIKRLTKATDGALPENCCLMQANCEDIWRLCVEQGLMFEAHYILYPNPWPKSEHLKRRWHGHSVFPFLKRLTKRTVLRSNWLIYLEEFALAWHQMCGVTALPKQFEIIEPLTLFEKKYALSGHELYQLELSV